MTEEILYRLPLYIFVHKITPLFLRLNYLIINLKVCRNQVLMFDLTIF